MASGANPLVESYLIEKYGADNVCWIIIWLTARDDEIKLYTTELNKSRATNTKNGNRPTGSSLGLHFVSYIEPRTILPPEPLLTPSIANAYDCSYDYILKSGQTDFVTLDIDYVWRRDGEWRGLELTTWYTAFTNKARAEQLISTMKTRPSWKGKHKSTALLKILEATKDLGLSDYMMCCVNTVGRSNIIAPDAKAYWFAITPREIARLSNGRPPENGTLGTFKDFLGTL
jgi:hypothetical protein